jgi:GTP-binding protein
VLADCYSDCVPHCICAALQLAVDEVKAGDICALSGIQNVSIGDTICSREYPVPLPAITVEEPTVRMTFLVNTSPFAGKDGKLVTS